MVSRFLVVLFGFLVLPCTRGEEVSVNRCKNPNACDPRTRCTDLGRDFRCSNCPTGFYRPPSQNNKGRCVDVNECNNGNGGCDQKTKCINSQGSFKCAPCPEGYSGNGLKGCIDIDECAKGNPCGSRECINKIGGYKCGPCKLGYKVQGSTCVDVDECAVNRGGCDSLTTCTNQEGGRVCGPCPTGYLGNGENGCEDVDECEESNGGCDPLVHCFNMPGKRECGPCPAGYRGNGYLGCKAGSGKFVSSAEKAKSISMQTAKKGAEATAVQYTALQDEWEHQDKIRQKEKVEEKEIRNLGSRLTNLRWISKVMTEGRMRKGVTTNLRQAKLIAEKANIQAAEMYRKGLTEYAAMRDGIFNGTNATAANSTLPKKTVGDDQQSVAPMD